MSSEATSLLQNIDARTAFEGSNVEASRYDFSLVDVEISIKVMGGMLIVFLSDAGNIMMGNRQIREKIGISRKEDFSSRSFSVDWTGS